MNAPPNIDPVTAHSDSDVVHWLTNDTRDERFIDNIFAELCVRLQRAGIPVKRASLHILTHHPQWLGARMMWADGMREAVIERVDYDVRERSEYIDSPANEIHEGATEVRENLERDPSLGRKHAGAPQCGPAPRSASGPRRLRTTVAPGSLPGHRMHPCAGWCRLVQDIV
jgi:adenylate cyclase